MTPPLECRSLAKHYGPVRALDGVDLTVQPGSVHGFLGPNGAGKTTLIRVTMGLLHPTAGEARLFGVPASRPEARRRVGFMGTDPVFYDALRGSENLDLLARLQGDEPTDRAWACALLDLDDDVLARPVRTYSSGMRQKLGIVQAVQHRPDLVVLDEPANRLDPIAHRAFEDLVRGIAASGRSVLLSSHTLSEVEEVCDRVAMIDRGRILLDAASEDLTARALRSVTVVYRDTPAAAPEGLVDPVVDGYELRGRLPARRPDVLRALLADPGVDDLVVVPASLEDVFLALYAEYER